MGDGGPMPLAQLGAREGKARSLGPGRSRPGGLGFGGSARAPRRVRVAPGSRKPLPCNGFLTRVVQSVIKALRRRPRAPSIYLSIEKVLMGDYIREVR